jgi:hypothetical protein
MCYIHYVIAKKSYIHSTWSKSGVDVVVPTLGWVLDGPSEKFVMYVGKLRPATLSFRDFLRAVMSMSMLFDNQLPLI